MILYSSLSGHFYTTLIVLEDSKRLGWRQNPRDTKWEETGEGNQLSRGGQ